MHHHNCHLLATIANELKSALAGQTFIKCFSNTPDEIYFEFNRFSFRCIFYKGELFFSFDDTLIGESRLYKPQFRDLNEQAVTEVVVHPYERSFHISFNNGLSLVFKCFGRKSNVILMNDSTCVDVFKKHLETDLSLTWPQLIRGIQPQYNEAAFNSKESFGSAYPYLSADVYQQFTLAKEKNAQSFDALIHQFNTANHLTFDQSNLSIALSNETESNILSEITRFTGTYLRVKTFSDRRDELLQSLRLQLKEKEAYFQSNGNALSHLSEKRKDEEIGNIILANLHAIPEGSKTVTVDDVYTQQPIQIKLDEHISAIKNAEAYFKKDKARPYILEQLRNKTEKAEQAIWQIKQQIHIVETAQSLKDLKLSGNKKKELTDKEEVLPYKAFTIEGYDIMVGKHAESNEKLLNYFSDKDDIWLHAKDVGGSHVIIKTLKNKETPTSVMEKAASLAAYYSKSRNQSLATVTYTLRKYVRKIKGADKGKVTVSNEQTLLVAPGLP
ncbi:MAG: NFACT RNA binding domain-containing protein [Bacteroidota bacterium]